MKKTTKTLSTIGTAIAATFTVNTATAESNPFAMTELDSGYMQLAQSDKVSEMECGSKMKMSKDSEAACGEGRCGSMMENGKMKKGLEKACGSMMKGKEGACGDLKDKSTGKAKPKGYSVNTSGWGKKKANNAGSGKMQGMDMDKGGMQGMCGGMMEGGKMKKGMEGMCGDMMKGKEGACGMGDMKGMGGKGGMQGMGGMNGGKGGMQGMGGAKGEEASCGAMIPTDKAAGK